MVKVEECPKCGKKGSLISRFVLNKVKKLYEPYFWISHYSAEKRAQGKVHVQSCYIPKKAALALLSQLVEDSDSPKERRKVKALLKAVERAEKERAKRKRAKKRAKGGEKVEAN